MSDVSFDEEPTYISKPYSAPQKPSFTNAILKSGLAKNEEGTERILLAIVLIAAVLSVGLLVKTFWKSSPGKPLPIQGTQPQKESSSVRSL